MEKPLNDPLFDLSDQAARLLRTMGHGPRLRILCMLLEQPCASGDLARSLGMREAAASQQLSLLRAERLIEARREGQRVIYALSSPLASKVLATLQETYCAQDRTRFVP